MFLLLKRKWGKVMLFGKRKQQIIVSEEGQCKSSNIPFLEVGKVYRCNCVGKDIFIVRITQIGIGFVTGDILSSEGGELLGAVTYYEPGSETVRIELPVFEEVVESGGR